MSSTGESLPEVVERRLRELVVRLHGNEYVRPARDVITKVLMHEGWPGAAEVEQWLGEVQDGKYAEEKLRVAIEALAESMKFANYLTKVMKANGINPAEAIKKLNEEEGR